MNGEMQPLSLIELLEWIEGEYRLRSEIFGIPENNFFRKKSSTSASVFGEPCDLPIGPAAGPHTQMSQNIIAAFLTGARYFELKTVQKLDTLDIEKPCIDARDEGYNTEWSTELTLAQAFDEYLKAWLILPILESTFGLGRMKGSPNSRGRPLVKAFVFNMSVGYDLSGIQSKKMDEFISVMIDASTHPSYTRYVEQIETFIQRQSRVFQAADQTLHRISPHMVASATLSTMHGCPPDEIQAICSYLLREKRLNVFVKLNPTLLGFQNVESFLEDHGFGYIHVAEESFLNDLQYPDAVRMVKDLRELSDSCGRGFGVKLSNTLGVMNHDGVLPGKEKYLSGRVLAPLTIRLARKLAEDIGVDLPISYAGGVSRLNVREILATGMQPITLATELLKPGGYLRFAGIVECVDDLFDTATLSPVPLINLKVLRQLDCSAWSASYYRKNWRFAGFATVGSDVPMMDCYTAPCINACPISQDVPGYISLLASKEYDKAIELIYRTNPLPHITGYICDHQCMCHCTRIDYEGPVRIRDLKRIAASRGTWTPVQGNSVAVRVAIIGAGPSGLATAYFLTRYGCTVEIFEKEQIPGGVVTHVLPWYRIPREAIRADIAVLDHMGVRFHFGMSQMFSIQKLKQQGFTYIFIAIGAEIPRRFTLKGNGRIMDSLTFLRTFNTHRHNLHFGRRVAVIGGGNTAMDSARTALRIADVESVCIIYRRSECELPADREEFENALHEGVEFAPLLEPVCFSKTGSLVCRRMKLGPVDDSNRRKPIPTNETAEFPVDTVISAIGEKVNTAVLRTSGLRIRSDGSAAVDRETLETLENNVFIGGDALREGSTVVQCIADARRVSESIVRRMGRIRPTLEPTPDQSLSDSGVTDFGSIHERKKIRISPAISPTNTDGCRSSTADTQSRIKSDDLLIQTESMRCLQCAQYCNKCVDVCPNRANVAIPVALPTEKEFRDPFQILHLDAFCNACGNCETFCPYDGSPHRAKLTLFRLYQDYAESENSGFVRVYCARSGEQNGVNFLLRIGGIEHTLDFDLDGKIIQSVQGEPNMLFRQSVLLIQRIVTYHAYLLGREKPAILQPWDRKDDYFK